jgi:serine phosphatase RsbU (regulator of sigma subunit)
VDGPDPARYLDTMPAAFWLLDGSWHIRSVNIEAERVTGCPRDHLLGRSLWNAFPALTGSPVGTAFRTAVATGAPMSVEAPGSRGGWFEIRAWPGPDGLAVYALDVTDRRAAEETARRATARTGLLTRVSAELSGELDTTSALSRLARLVVPVLADACIVTVVDREGRPRDIGSWHGDPVRRPLLDHYADVRLDSMPSASPVAQALSEGTPVTESIAAVLDLMPPGTARELLVALSPATAVVLPLTADSGTVGVLTLYQDPGRVVTDEDMETAWQVAAEAGRAIARVHRQSQQAQLAEVLQRSLLTEPPALEEAAVVVRYLPAAEAAQVGGDWYDAFQQRDGRLVVVIGDVVGHDTAAAAEMGQLRGLLRGIAHHSGAGPAEILRGLDEAVVQMYPETLATAAVGRLEDAAAGARFRWANAGHPPPMLLRPDGGVTVLGGPIGDLMLGVDPTAERAEQDIGLLPGTTVLLFTDGLVESRRSTLDAGMARLAAHLRDLAGHPLDDLCDAVLHRMVQGTPQDDVALVALRVGRRGDASHPVRVR